MPNIIGIKSCRNFVTKNDHWIFNFSLKTFWTIWRKTGFLEPPKLQILLLMLRSGQCLGKGGIPSSSGVFLLKQVTQDLMKMNLSSWYTPEVNCCFSVRTQNQKKWYMAAGSKGVICDNVVSKWIEWGLTVHNTAYVASEGRSNNVLRGVVQRTSYWSNLVKGTWYHFRKQIWDKK